MSKSFEQNPGGMEHHGFKVGSDSLMESFEREEKPDTLEWVEDISPVTGNRIQMAPVEKRAQASNTPKSKPDRHVPYEEERNDVIGHTKEGKDIHLSDKINY